MDRLTPLLARFDLKARVFHAGALCGVSRFDGSDGVGHLHVLRSGRLRVWHDVPPAVELTQPTLLFYPRATDHRLEVDASDPADLLCASIDFGAPSNNPLLRSLPSLLTVPMASAPALAPALALLFAEAFGQRCGRQDAVDRLTEYVVIQLLRHAMAEQLVNAGAMSGLSDPRLARAINAMHENPAERWTVASLASLAGMSRARFAVHFLQRVGATPMDYLTDWRLGLVRAQLRRGRPLKQVAQDVGYASTGTLSRVFQQRTGRSPSEWLRST